MYRKSRMELIVRCMILPFCESSFFQNDFLKDAADVYKRLCERTEDYKKAKEDLLKIKVQIDHYFSSDLRNISLDDAEMVLEVFYPRKKMATYLQHKEIIEWFYYDQILELSDIFVTFREGCPALKTIERPGDPLTGYGGFNKIELWQTLTRMMMPDVIIAGYFVTLKMENQEYLINIPNILNIKDIPLSTVLEKGVAETHMHFGAGATYCKTWENIMNFQLWHFEIESFNQQYGEEYAALSIFRFIFAAYLEDAFLNKKELRPFDDYITDHFPKFNQKLTMIFDNIIINQCQDSNIDIYLRDCVMEPYFMKEGRNEFQDILEETVYPKIHNGVTAETIFLYRALKFFEKYRFNTLATLKSNTNYLLKLFIAYIRHKNIFFSDKVQSNKISGLKFFSYHYNASTKSMEYRRVKSNVHKQRAENLAWGRAIFNEQFKNKNLKKIEIKISPPPIATIPDSMIGEDESYQIEILRWIKVILSAYRESVDVVWHEDKKASVPMLGIVYHFIKKSEPDNFSGKTCRFIQENANNLEYEDYYSMQLKAQKFVNTLLTILNKWPLLAEYVVGIDAAAQENESEPWVFAPVFRKTRTKMTTVHTTLNDKYPIQNIGFTFHIGEDFRHILSGLRHIDEVLDHFCYMSGDRIGHGIALGVDINHWVEHNEIVCLPIGEYLEDLIWIWGFDQAGNKGVHFLNIEFKIMEVVRSIFPSIKGLSVFLLWEAYQKNFLGLDSKTITLLNDKFKDKKNCVDYQTCIFPNESGESAWDVETLRCVYYCPCYFEALQKPIFVKVEKEEIAIYEDLQKRIIRKVEEKGVYVETNPTSNTAIGEVDGLLSHPGIYLNNDDLEDKALSGNSVMITINSDDPLVFNTNVENEIAYIYYALIYKGYTREKILNWVDKIRQHGLDSSFIKRIKDISTVKKELDVLIDDVLKDFG